MLHPQPRLFDSRHALFEIDNLDERRLARHGRRDRITAGSPRSPSSRVIAVIGKSTSCLEGTCVRRGRSTLGASGSAAKGRKVCRNCCNHTKSPASEPMTAMTRDDGDLGDILILLGLLLMMEQGCCDETHC